MNGLYINTRWLDHHGPVKLMSCSLFLVAIAGTESLPPSSILWDNVSMFLSKFQVSHKFLLYLRIFHLLVITYDSFTAVPVPSGICDRINIKKKTGWSDQLIIASFANCASQTSRAWRFPSGSWDICVKSLSTWKKTCEKGILWK